MEQDIQNFTTIEEYQAYLKERQELLGYCKKISQGIENLDEKSGERAIWELVQNARDMDSDCMIKIELNTDSIIFSHHGKPFDYLSLLALVNQNSSKDNPGTDLVGQYGTGFMTTHAFNDIVSVDGPFKVMANPTTVKGYVTLGGFILNRSFRNDTELAIREMRKEMKLVNDMHKKQPLYPDYESLEEKAKWTSFTYELNTNQVESVSQQLSSAIRLMPMVLVINERIKEVEVHDYFVDKHYKVYKTTDENRNSFKSESKWMKVDNQIVTKDLKSGDEEKTTLGSLQSEDGSDVIILPPYPKSCGTVDTIPSLFLWFPLLGTEFFGVNFIFHSKRFHPVEKRNNILLPEKVPSKIVKGQHNESVLKEMMQNLHAYYAIEGNDTALTRQMCIVNFKSDKDDEVTTKFYTDLQEMWKTVVPQWKIIPTTEGKKSITEPRVKVLHPDFYSKLDAEKRKEYESTLALFAESVKYSEEDTYLIPNEDLIAWSETVNQWGCQRDSDFFITVEDVCKAVQGKSENLHKFLLFLKESGNDALLDQYALLPNRKGELKTKTSLRHGDFMTENLYNLTSLLMGSDADKMIDTSFNDICTVGEYKAEELQRAISQTIIQWRNSALNAQNRTALTEEQKSALISFCSTSSLEDFTNFRGRMMAEIVKVYNKTLTHRIEPKVIDKEDDFYNPAFNFLLDYTLYTISTKEEDWIKDNRALLLSFVKEYATSTAIERVNKLDDYAVIPNQNGALCIKKELYKNVNIDDTLAVFYKTVMGEDLQDKWVAVDFQDLFTYSEQKASEVANDVQNKLAEGDFKDTIVLDIIELAENETIDNWKILFRTIFKEKESIRYNLGTAQEHRAINQLMKKKNPELLEKMAKVAEREDAMTVMDNIDYVIDQMEHEAYLKMLGDYVETHIQQYLIEALSDIDITVNNQQGGQDFIITKEGFNDYYIEVKSRWESDQSVEMSATQLKRAVDNNERYALIGVNMYDFDRERAKNNEALPLSDIYTNIKVLDNIGHLEEDLKKRTDEAFKGNNTEIRLDGSYKVRVPQNVFDAYPLDFNGFVKRLREKFHIQ